MNRARSLTSIVCVGAYLVLTGTVNAQKPDVRNQASGSDGTFTVSGRVLYNPNINDCFQEVPCIRDLALTDSDDWVPPKAAVNIVAKSTGSVAKADREGNFSIEVSAPNDALLFLYIGHNRVEVPVNGRDHIDVRLTPTPIPIIERLLGQIIPIIDAGEFPDIDELAQSTEVSRATARDIVWLVLGNTRMRQYYPGEFVPDYRFDEDD